MSAAVYDVSVPDTSDWHNANAAYDLDVAAALIARSPP